MPRFAVKEIEAFKTRTKVFKLLRDDKCDYDEFVLDIEKDNNLEPELSDIDAIIEDAADGKLLPGSKYHKIDSPKTICFSIFEAKNKHLRVYLLHENETGKILILGGKKKTQEKDIDRVHKIVKEYCKSKKTK
ncbi:MAG: hypothetical protein NTU44_04685 [Bacteroidetes bacterium]|nr:hypothetical protein [Bacteroidota bacterium]